MYKSQKDGYYTWTEFVEFFMTKDMKQHEKIEGEGWWNHIDSSGHMIVKQADEGDNELTDSKLDLMNQTTQNNPNSSLSTNFYKMQ